MFRLDSKVAVIFGGSGYLGKQFCSALLKQGAVVVNLDQKLFAKTELLDCTPDESEKFHSLKVNATDENELKKNREKIIKDFGKVDILINSTTMKGNDFYLPFEDVSLEGWNIGLLGNLTIPFLTIKNFIPLMKEQQHGSIINISSIYSIVGNDQRLYEGSNLHEIYVKNSPNIKQIYSHGVYNAAKGGLNSFTRYLAAYYGKYNIRVNTLTPGGIYYEGENETFLKKYGERTPLGRKANPDEINGALIFLASDDSTYVTGHNLVVDGGFSIW
ncbi:MAG: SDR family oxidoreductase [Melioribacteraceae bacterium]|nr:SDR family oxidoreductase [Saprospiraceae bacterium]MCF8355744.1 SDR family oxidoreductase [Melioribacteraceae bacterium]MCF8394772.1 SDR family oxidoreductase [Melioribacteraceae bacterium]